MIQYYYLIFTCAFRRVLITNQKFSISFLSKTYNMNRIICSSLIYLIFRLNILTLGQEAQSAYCYRLTWVGPRSDIDVNAFADLTCDDFTNGYEKVPCRRPLVMTTSNNDPSNPDNTLPPDMGALWDKHTQNNTNSTNQIACRLNKNDVCLKHVYKYNNKGKIFFYFI